MRAEILGTVSEREPGLFVVSIMLGEGEKAREICLAFRLADLVPACQDYAETTKSPFKITSLSSTWWLFRGKVVTLLDVAGLSAEEQQLEVMHAVLKRDRRYERMRRTMRSYETMDRAEKARREVISEAVRIFVWQRDAGKCVKCGSQELLEFDHIVPVVKGGSSTERNIQLLCERCNREKGGNI